MSEPGKSVARVEPPIAGLRWSFPENFLGTDSDLIVIGADLEPGTILDAYRRGLFPMNYMPHVLGWWSPDPRGILPLDSLHVSRSLRRSIRRFEIRVDTAFRDVIAGCADPRRPHGWITPEIIAAYTRLHELGWAHSIEAWTRDGALAGGLYGVAIGGLFAAESKFHAVTDASKAAVAGLVDLMRAHGGALLDVQWRTDHLARLGVVEVSRVEYLRRLEEAIRLPPPEIFRGSPV